jgi:DNA repair exonuclease SbcCD ATPase subunit
MDTGLLLALVGLGVAGLAAVLGIWMERDPNRPPRWAIALTILIGAATVVSLFQSVADAAAAAKNEEDLARMLQTLDRISTDSGGENPELANFISKEMATQTRSNPDVIKKMSARVSAEGGDPNDILARHLPASEIKGLAGAKGKAAPAGGANPQELKKLKDEVAGLKKKLADAKAAGEGSETAKKAAEEAKKEKAEAESKIEQLEKELQRLQKQNERLKGKSSGGTSRWDKG